jgi:hypothetical protein
VLKGKPMAAMFNLILEDWEATSIMPWVNEIVESFNYNFEKYPRWNETENREREESLIFRGSLAMGFKRKKS